MPSVTLQLESLTSLSEKMQRAPAVGPFELHWVDARRRSEMLSVWQVVEQQLADVPLMASSEWIECWLRHYGDLVPHRFVTLQADSRYVAVALLTRGVDQAGGLWGERTWHLGTAGEPDHESVCVEYNGWACLPEVREIFIRQLIAAVQAEPDWDSLHFDGFAEYDLPTWLLDDPEWECVRKPARWVDLAAVRSTDDELIQSFGDSTRKGIRQNIRKMGQVRFEWAETTDHALHIFSDLVSLHQERWNSVGEPGCYASQRFTDFHRDLIQHLAPQQRMILVRVSAEDRIVGASQLLIDRGRALVYQGGRLADEAGSPGLVTDFLAMQECLNRGYAAYDFMAGDSMHKRRLTTHATPLVWASYRRPRWRRSIVNSLRSVKRYCRTWLSGSRSGSAATDVAARDEELDT
jgi:hypothetical protein